MCKALMSLRLDLEGRISRNRFRRNRDEEMGGGRHIMRWRLLNRRRWIISRGCLSLLMGHDDVGELPITVYSGLEVLRWSCRPRSSTDPNEPHHQTRRPLCLCKAHPT